jgi:tyrosyl-tRNA synthetase
MGGGTTKVGDPSGKDETRKLLTSSRSTPTWRASSASFAKFLTFGDGATDAVMVDNAEWLDKLNYIASCATSAGTSRSTAC